MSDKIPKQLEHKEIIKCVPSGKYIGNYKCHANCLSYAKMYTKNVHSIIGVAQVYNDNTCCAHFILKMKDGTYFDPTYGNMVDVLYSYCIFIESYEVSRFNPNRELRSLQEYLYGMRSFMYKLIYPNKYLQIIRYYLISNKSTYHEVLKNI
jgi:hypothetical protein